MEDFIPPFRKDPTVRALKPCSIWPAAVFTSCVLMSVLAHGGADDVVLVRDGEPVASIVIADNPTLSARLAALELQHHIELITGARLPIVGPEKATDNDACILVGESAATRQIGLKDDDFHPQEYLIRVGDNAVVLIGRDWRDTPASRAEKGLDTNLRSLDDWRKTIDYSEAIDRSRAEKEQITLPGGFDDQGTCYATYDFLERFCGVRWYGPTPLNVVAPTMQTLSIAPVEIRRAPSLLHRYATGGSWPIIRKQWNKPTNSQLQLFYRRMRVGGEKWAGNHSQSSFQDHFLKKNPNRPDLWERYEPDFFARGWENEGNWRQLCLTNPELVLQVAQDARDFFDGKGIKGNQPACGDYFVIVPADSDHWCKCDRCQAVLAPGKARDIKYAFGTGTASDYVFGFVNAVAREVAKTHPDKFIATLAYHVYSYPPTFELEPNVAVAPCVQLCYAYQTGTFKNDAKFYGEWVDDKGRRIHLWNYFHHPMERAILGGWKCFPCFMPDVISEWVKRYHRDGVRGFYLCGLPQQLDYYLYMQTAFNAETDCEKLMDEFFVRYFGEAAGVPMQQFHDLISQANREEGVLGTTEEASWERLGTEARMKTLYELMDLAVEKAGTDLEKRRVATWKDGVWDYMTEGRNEYVKKKRAHEKKEIRIAIYSTGVDDDHRLLKQASPDPHWRLAAGSDRQWSGPRTYVAGNTTAPIPPWLAQSNDSKSQWISPRKNNTEVAGGIYAYEQTFDLIDVDLETVSIFGRIAGDDSVNHIEMNGKNVGQGGATFIAWQDFLITDHFIAGKNTIRVVVTNDGEGVNPHGLRVELIGYADGKR